MYDMITITINALDVLWLSLAGVVLTIGIKAINMFDAGKTNKDTK